MTLEQLIQAILNATPQQRRRIEATLNGKPENTAGNGKVKSETRLVTITGATKLLAVSRDSVYKLIDQKRLDTVELSGSRRITMRSINEFLDGERPANKATEKQIAANKAKYAASRSDA